MTWLSIVGRVLVPCLLLIPAKADHVPRLTDSEAYAVYAALLPTKGDRLLISSMTIVPGYNCLPTGKPMKAEWKSVVDNFKRRNTIPRVLQPRISTNLRYELRPQEMLTTHSLWSIGFYDPGNRTTLMRLSSVGFDTTRTRAIVYVIYSCGELCGKGMYQLLEKKNGKWETVDPPGINWCVSFA